MRKTAPVWELSQIRSDAQKLRQLPIRGTEMPVYRDTVLTLDRQRRPRVVRIDGHRIGAPDRRDDGVLIFCGLSLALLIIASWAAASGHADVAIVMF